MFRLKRPKLRYITEFYSLYNGWIRNGFLVLMIFGGLVGTLMKVEDTPLTLLVLLVIYIGFGIWTLIIYIKKMKFIKNGRSTSGVIVDILTEYPRNELHHNEGMMYIKFKVKYKNPFTKKEVITKTPWMTGGASRLKSNDVTVYVLEDGRDYVTYFDV